MDSEPVRVLILRGEGPAFCAGVDLKDKAISKADKPFLQTFECQFQPTFILFWPFLVTFQLRNLHFALRNAFSNLIKKMREIPQPIVCGVNGPAVGAGMSLALAADLRVGTPSSRFAASFVSRGPKTVKPNGSGSWGWGVASWARATSCRASWVAREPLKHCSRAGRSAAGRQSSGACSQRLARWKEFRNPSSYWMLFDVHVVLSMDLMFFSSNFV